MLKELNIAKYIKNNYKLDDFDIIKVDKKKKGALGIGSFATVNLAREKHSKKLYALKQIHIREKNEKIDKENLRREVLIHRHLRNENIVKFYDLFEDGGKVYIVIEYAKNGNLFNYLHKHRRFSEIEAFKFFYQSLKAIKYMHDKKLVHRDIKPENILLNELYDVKLCDFGWSTVRAKNEKMRTFCGTYEYMAPELLQKRTYDYTVDIWALGILLFELMHGFSPYRAKKIEDILENINSKKIKFSRRISSEVKDLIKGILQVKPSKRLKVEEILEHPWILKYKKIQNLESKGLKKQQSNCCFKEYKKRLKQEISKISNFIKSSDQQPKQFNSRIGKIQKLAQSKSRKKIDFDLDNIKNITSLLTNTTDNTKSKHLKNSKKKKINLYQYSKPTPLKILESSEVHDKYGSLIKKFNQYSCSNKNSQKISFDKKIKISDFTKPEKSQKVKQLDLVKNTQSQISDFQKVVQQVKSARLELISQLNLKTPKQKKFNNSIVNNIKIETFKKEKNIIPRSKKNSLQDLLKNARKVRKVQKISKKNIKRYNSQCQLNNFKNLLYESKSLYKNLNTINTSSSQSQFMTFNKTKQQRPQNYSKIKQRQKFNNNENNHSNASILSRSVFSTNDKVRFKQFKFGKKSYQKENLTSRKNSFNKYQSQNISRLNDIRYKNKTKFQFFDDETSRIIAKYITVDQKEQKCQIKQNKFLYKQLYNGIISQDSSRIFSQKQSQLDNYTKKPNFKKWQLQRKQSLKSKIISQNSAQITPRKGVKSNFISAKKSIDNFSSGFTGKKETCRVLNLKDMNNKSNQLNSKINHCFGDFYKKLDTFANQSKNGNENGIYSHYFNV